jgi:mannan polymerase II complex MNN11 subunit
VKGPEKTDIYKDGDFVIRFSGCDLSTGSRNCEIELEPYYKKWERGEGSKD